MNPRGSKYVGDNRNRILTYKIVRFVGLCCINYSSWAYEVIDSRVLISVIFNAMQFSTPVYYLDDFLKCSIDVQFALFFIL